VIENLLGALVGLAIIVYLVYALTHADRF